MNNARVTNKQFPPSLHASKMMYPFIKVISASFADFSLSEIMRLLCFKSEEQTVEFLRAYSLKVSSAGQVRRIMASSLFSS